MRTESSSSYWEGSAFRLRATELDDWELFFSMNQDDDMARRLYRVPFPQSKEAVRQWTAQESTRKPEGDDFHFVIQDGAGKAVGSVATHDCDRRNGTLSYGVAIHRPARRRGYARGAITLLLRYYFQELRYQKATITVYSFNEASIRLHEALGFQREGQVRRMGSIEGRYFDHLIYGITVEEFLAGQPRASQEVT